jgi:hypothetical protein
MHPHRIHAKRPTRLASIYREIWFQRHRIAAAAALAFTTAALVLGFPWLLALALLEHHRSGRRKRLFGLIILIALAHAVLWLWREIRRYPLEPRGPWHACAQCGFPISNRSRARYCSAVCRRIGLLERRARSDDRAAARLERLRQPSLACDSATAEIPF